MASLPSRQTLESMKRADLQKICKDYGVKANLKSEALIDLLLGTIKPTPSNAPKPRSVSTRVSSRAGPSRISSIVIHDTGDEDLEEEQAEEIYITDAPQLDVQPATQPEMETIAPPATRSRKGKEQTRLGVGRPVAAGGAGPRAVTKSLSLSKKRGKGSRSVKPSEATIVEEIEPEHQKLPQDNSPEPIVTRETSPPLSNTNPSPEASLESLASIDQRVADAIRPLHEQIKSMKSELELMQTLKIEVKQLKSQLEEMRSLKQNVETLTATLQDLRKGVDDSASLRLELKQLKESMTTPPIAPTPTPTTPILQMGTLKKRAGPGGFGFPSSLPRQEPSFAGLSGPSTSTPFTGRPSAPLTQTMLGKRQRDSTTSDIPEEHDLDEMAMDSEEQRETKPSRKRIKIAEDEEPSATQFRVDEPGAEEASIEVVQEPVIPASPRIPSFTVFSGLDEPSLDFMDPPPPTEQLPDHFPPPSPPPRSETTITRQSRTATAGASENQPFSFFQPLSSTPAAHNLFLPSFPYPEPPQSPSPAGMAGVSNQDQPGRSDVFQAFGFPAPGRPSRASAARVASGLGGRFVNPAALSRIPSDNDGGASPLSSELTMRASESNTGAAAEVPQLKRTMYGTELEGDTRFGDFGLEGVGNGILGGFWAGGRY
ncbi:hypothetical protein H0H81_003784 [Sphagnurus paluster]|uniref:Uncharacterized protein n=1 Tax=Sphagnurus paluster TaxID=117069 RepID=A0A9P7KJ90_9AGAR|nr:hypothetical protein H0H81_003784 [Sphagnurus paluster]